MIAAALALLIVLPFALRKERNAGPPCKPSDCDTCPFPPCTEAEKRKHIRSHGIGSSLADEVSGSTEKR